MVQGKTDQHARQIHVSISHEVIIGAAIISVYEPITSALFIYVDAVCSAVRGSIMYEDDAVMV